MNAQFWTYAELVKITADELTQLIKSFERKKRGANRSEAMSISAALKRAKFVLYAVGNVLPKEVQIKKPQLASASSETQEETIRTHTFTDKELLEIVNLQIVVCSQRFTPKKQVLLQALHHLSNARAIRRKE
jgi:hypothetical protein